MNRLFSLLPVFCLMLLTACEAEPRASVPVPKLAEGAVVEAGCGRCLFGRKEDKKCNLAIRMDGESYFVDGFTMRQFGDPDEDGGMCKKSRQATVKGEIVDGRFAATQFDLLPATSE